MTLNDYLWEERSTVSNESDEPPQERLPRQLTSSAEAMDTSKPASKAAVKKVLEAKRSCTKQRLQHHMGNNATQQRKEHPQSSEIQTLRVKLQALERSVDIRMEYLQEETDSSGERLTKLEMKTLLQDERDDIGALQASMDRLQLQLEELKAVSQQEATRKEERKETKDQDQPKLVASGQPSPKQRAARAAKDVTIHRDSEQTSPTGAGKIWRVKIVSYLLSFILTVFVFFASFHVSPIGSDALAVYIARAFTLLVLTVVVVYLLVLTVVKDLCTVAQRRWNSKSMVVS